ncbi:MAG: FecR family protein [Oceanococcus sp.]
MQPFFIRIIFSLVALSWVSLAAATAGTITDVTGNVVVIRADAKYRAIVGSKLQKGDVVKTNAFSKVSWTLQDDSKFDLRSNTKLSITDFQFERKSSGFGRLLFNLAEGGFRSLTGLVGSRNRSSYLIRTPVATMGIRGTDYTLFHLTAAAALELGKEPGTYVFVTSGSVELKNDKGTLIVKAGQSGFAPLGQVFAPVLIPDMFEVLRKLSLKFELTIGDDEYGIDLDPTDFNLLPQPTISAAPTATPAVTPTPTTSTSPQPTASPGTSPTPTGTPTPSPTGSAGPTPSSAPSPSPTPSPSPSPSPSASPSASPLPSTGPTETPASPM